VVTGGLGTDTCYGETQNTCEPPARRGPTTNPALCTWRSPTTTRRCVQRDHRRRLGAITDLDVGVLITIRGSVTSRSC